MHPSIYIITSQHGVLRNFPIKNLSEEISNMQPYISEHRETPVVSVWSPPHSTRKPTDGRTDGRTESADVLTHCCSEKHVSIRLSFMCLQTNGSFKFGLLHPQKRMNYEYSTSLHSSLIVRRVSYIHTYIHTYIVTYRTRMEREYCIIQQTKLPVMLFEV